MLFEKMAEMISRAPIAALDDVTRALWAAVSAAQLDEAQALRLSEAIDARRMHSKGVQAAAGRGLLPARVAPPRKHQRPPERSEARERSRRWAAAGRMPPAIACKFTQGEQAALAVITVEMTKRQTCTMAIGAIAALAGVSESTVKRESTGLRSCSRWPSTCSRKARFVSACACLRKRLASRTCTQRLSRRCGSFGRNGKTSRVASYREVTSVRKNPTRNTCGALQSENGS
jgi:hypothetical protein